MIYILVDTADGYRLNDLNKLNPSRFILLNHASVLLQWDNGRVSLETNLKKILKPTDKYAIITFSQIAASNLFPILPINQLLKRNTINVETSDGLKTVFSKQMGDRVVPLGCFYDEGERYDFLILLIAQSVY